MKSKQGLRNAAAEMAGDEHCHIRLAAVSHGTLTGTAQQSVNYI